MSKTKRLLSVVGLGILLVLLSTVAYAAVELSYFQGDWDESSDTVTLSWGTASELDNAGFHVWRSEVPLEIIDGQIDTTVPGVVRLTSSIISSESACTVQGSDYEFEDDDLGVLSEYYYYLESFHCQNAGSEFYGDGESGLRVTRENVLYLPTVLC